MSDVEIEFAEGKTDWQADEMLAGRYRLASPDARDVDRLEFSVLWYTSGKGDEDLEVHLHEESRADSPDWSNPGDWRSFSCPLPQTPLSYDGVLVKIHWCVRVRYFAGSKQILGEASFRLGEVAQGQKVEKS